MTTCARPAQDYPLRVPLKVIGREAEMDPAALAEVIAHHLGPQAEADRLPSAARKGPYVSLTFWVLLPDDQAEAPLRTALQAQPGVVMQL